MLIAVMIMAYRVGQRLYFWNWNKRFYDELVVTALSSDGIGFQFRYDKKLMKCTYEYAEGRLYTSPNDIPEYRRMLEGEARYREKQIALQREREAEYVRKQAFLAQAALKARDPITPSCDNCFRRWSGECTSLKSVLCDEYRAGPVADYSVRGD